MKRIVAALAVALAVAGSAFAQTAIVHSVNNAFNKVATYHAATITTLATTPYDFIELKGSATKTVYLKSVRVVCTKTAGGYNYITMAKRTAVAQGGTSAIVTPAASDSSNATATAVLAQFTANPTTPGAGVSMIQQYVGMPVSITGADSSAFQANFGQFVDQYVVLRGVAQTVTLGFAGQTTTGGVCTTAVTWLEM